MNRRRPYGLRWRIRLALAVLQGDVVAVRTEISFADRWSRLVVEISDGEARRWRL